MALGFIEPLAILVIADVADMAVINKFQCLPVVGIGERLYVVYSRALKETST